MIISRRLSGLVLSMLSILATGCEEDTYFTPVAQHHEAPDGTGFPHGLTHTRISNFSAVFIVAEAFVLHMETASPTPSLTTFLHEKGEKYSGGAFRKIQEALLLMRKQSESPPNLSAA